MKNHTASEFIKFKKRKLNLAQLGKHRKKKGRCKKCGQKADRIIKGDCSKCYARNQARTKSRKKNFY